MTCHISSLKVVASPLMYVSSHPDCIFAENIRTDLPMGLFVHPAPTNGYLYASLVYWNYIAIFDLANASPHQWKE
jgi:hypothetical protein